MIKFSKSFVNKIYQRINFSDKEAETVMVFSISLKAGMDRAFELLSIEHSYDQTVFEALPLQC